MNTIPNIEQLAHLATLASDLVNASHFDPENMGLTWKEDDTPLTVADRGVRDIVARYMSEHFPHVAVVGEEGQLGERTGSPDEHWMLVDEVDGTWAYMLGVPVFTSMFAIMRGNQPIMSAIVDPISRRLYLAERGAGAFLNGSRIQVSKELPSTPNVGYVSWPRRNLPGDMLVPGMVKEVVVGLHEMGCIPVNMVTIGYFDALVASGKLQGSIFPGKTLHDTAAGHLLVEEAGGKATDLRGDALHYGGTQSFGHIFSAGGEFHDTLVELVRNGL